MWKEKISIPDKEELGFVTMLMSYINWSKYNHKQVLQQFFFCKKLAQQSQDNNESCVFLLFVWLQHRIFRFTHIWSPNNKLK